MWCYFMKKILYIATFILLGIILYACKPEETEQPVETKLEDLTTTQEKVSWWIDHLTIEEKIGQMIQAERTTNNGQSGATAFETTNFNLGSILNGGGNVPPVNTVSAWKTMSSTYRNASLNSS